MKVTTDLVKYLIASILLFSAALTQAQTGHMPTTLYPMYRMRNPTNWEVHRFEFGTVTYPQNGGTPTVTPPANSGNWVLDRPVGWVFGISGAAPTGFGLVQLFHYSSVSIMYETTAADHIYTTGPANGDIDPGAYIQDATFNGTWDTTLTPYVLQNDSVVTSQYNYNGPQFTLSGNSQWGWHSCPLQPMSNFIFNTNLHFTTGDTSEIVNLSAYMQMQSSSWFVLESWYGINLGQLS